jgi:hypothetical protein
MGRKLRCFTPGPTLGQLGELVAPKVPVRPRIQHASRPGSRTRLPVTITNVRFAPRFMITISGMLKREVKRPCSGPTEPTVRSCRRYG